MIWALRSSWRQKSHRRSAGHVCVLDCDVRLPADTNATTRVRFHVCALFAAMLLLPFVASPCAYGAANQGSVDVDSKKLAPEKGVASDKVKRGGDSATKGIDESGTTLDQFFGRGKKNITSGSKSKETDDSWSSFDFTKFLIAGTILLFVFGALIVLRKIRPVPRDGSGHRLLEVVGRLTIGSKQQLCLVRVGQRVLVLGLSSERVQLLTELDKTTDVMEFVSTRFKTELKEEEGAILKEFEQMEGNSPAKRSEAFPSDLKEVSTQESSNFDTAVPQDRFQNEVGKIERMVQRWKQSGKGGE